METVQPQVWRDGRSPRDSRQEVEVARRCTWRQLVMMASGRWRRERTVDAMVSGATATDDAPPCSAMLHKSVERQPARELQRRHARGHATRPHGRGPLPHIFPRARVINDDDDSEFRSTHRLREVPPGCWPQAAPYRERLMTSRIMSREAEDIPERPRASDARGSRTAPMSFSDGSG